MAAGRDPRASRGVGSTTLSRGPVGLLPRSPSWTAGPTVDERCPPVIAGRTRVTVRSEPKRNPTVAYPRASSALDFPGSCERGKKTASELDDRKLRALDGSAAWLPRFSCRRDRGATNPEVTSGVLRSFVDEPRRRRVRGLELRGEEGGRPVEQAPGAADRARGELQVAGSRYGDLLRRDSGTRLRHPPSPPRISQSRMIPMRAGREPKRCSRAFMSAQVRGLLRRRIGVLGRS